MSSAPFPRQVLVVCERERRTHARSLVRAAATYQPTEWCFDTEFEGRMRPGRSSRNIFLGDSKYADFLRGLAGPVARKHGIVWTLYKRHALIYTEDVIIDHRATLPKVREQLEQVTLDARYHADSVSYQDGVVEGPLIAHEFLQATQAQPAFRADMTPTSERDVKRLFAEAQYTLAIAWFLMEGWDELLNAHDPADPE